MSFGHGIAFLIGLLGWAGAIGLACYAGIVPVGIGWLLAFGLTYVLTTSFARRIDDAYEGAGCGRRVEENIERGTVSWMAIAIGLPIWWSLIACVFWAAWYRRRQAAASATDEK